MHLSVDFLGIYDILFSVMRDRIELEEVFDNEELTAREMEAIDRMERARKQVKLQASMFWFIQKRRQQADWS